MPIFNSGEPKKTVVAVVEVGAGGGDGASSAISTTSTGEGVGDRSIRGMGDGTAVFVGSGVFARAILIPWGGN